MTTKAQPAKAKTFADLPEAVELHRDRVWRRDEENRVETAREAEAMIERAGFAHLFGDERSAGASLYAAVCGRRDAHVPRDRRTDSECQQTLFLRDEIVRRGALFYGRTRGGRTLFVAPRLVPYFHQLCRVPPEDEERVFSAEARAILFALEREWEMASTDLRRAAKIKEYATCARAIEELARAMRIVVSDFVPPRRTQVWTLIEARFGAELKKRVAEEDALREIARAFLVGAGVTLAGELARATGLSRRDAGRGNHLLVAEGSAVRLGRGIYRLIEFDDAPRVAGW